jgi:hypothetical protein
MKTCSMEHTIMEMGRNNKDILQKNVTLFFWKF